MDAGKFITLEGPEGGGKSTQARHLAARLSRAGMEVVSVREPGGTRAGELIRDILQHDKAAESIPPNTEALLFNASRAQLVHHVIRPALRRGAWVVCDRFADSTTVYQGYGRGLDIETLLRLNAFAVGEIVPDLTLVLDLPVEIGFERLQARMAGGGGGHDRIEREDLDFHRRIRNGYLELARQDPNRFRVVDASADIEAVALAIRTVVNDVLGTKI